MRLLTLLCDLEVNGNLQSKLQQVVEKERECLLQDNLLQGLLESAALRHCLDTTIENVLHGKIKVLEVRLQLETNYARLRVTSISQYVMHSTPLITARLCPTTASSFLAWCLFSTFSRR